MNASELIKHIEEQINIDKMSIRVKEKILDDLRHQFVKISTSQDSEISINDLNHTIKRRKCFTNEIREIIMMLGNQEFTMDHIDIIYRKKYNPSANREINRIRISNTLAKFRASGAVKLTSKGEGRARNKYIAIGSAEELAKKLD